jgi:predicted dinucleotide-binding enzyme
MSKKQTVGILGSGAVGQTLASAFLSEGHEVLLGSRTPTKEEVVKWKNNNPKGQTGTFEEAAKFGDLLVVCTLGEAAENAVQLGGIENFTGKILIDTTNPIAHEAPVDGVLKYFTSLDNSLLERLQALLPQAHLVKAFSSVGNTLMYKPNLPGGTPSMFICGNDEKAKQTVTNILTDFGWETEDMGKATAARAIEPLCMLWCIPGFLKNQWSHAFKLLKS